MKSHFELSDVVISKVEWLGFFVETKIGMKWLLLLRFCKTFETKWLLEKDDKDMIVMQHQFIYELKGIEHELHSSL